MVFLFDPALCEKVVLLLLLFLLLIFFVIDINSSCLTLWQVYRSAGPQPVRPGFDSLSFVQVNERSRMHTKAQGVSYLTVISTLVFLDQQISQLDVTFLVFDIYKCSDKDEKTSRASRLAGRSEGGVETVSLKSENFFQVSPHSILGAVLKLGKVFQSPFQVQQPMLRPKSTHGYIPVLERIAEDFLAAKVIEVA